MNPLNLADALARIPDHWHPRVIGRVNGTDVRLAKLEGEIVPRGVEHRPVAPEEVHVMLIEPAGTVNTGNVRNERTVQAEELGEAGAGGTGASIAG